ncbi:hypothetical protein EYF80_052522 [Liparis tanakae]|uniref:Uncharacterized protein n=1 Tax=Liparis tanakae TaxID=230148 RepID=A0A4Z2F929_9TELE|nr:hypothetical protein EYF80_052522 [Liparis tanakae]
MTPVLLLLLLLLLSAYTPHVFLQPSPPSPACLEDLTGTQSPPPGPLMVDHVDQITFTCAGRSPPPAAEVVVYFLNPKPRPCDAAVISLLRNVNRQSHGGGAAAVASKTTRGRPMETDGGRWRPA